MYSIEGIVAFTTAPLAIASVMGVLLCFVAILMIFVIIIKTLVFGDPTSGWPSMVSIMLLMGGLQFLVIGILGEYISKTYLETKNRPIYIIKETEKTNRK